MFATIIVTLAALMIAPLLVKIGVLLVVKLMCTVLAGADTIKKTLDKRN